jgi:hypothetical protein
MTGNHVKVFGIIIPTKYVFIKFQFWWVWGDGDCRLAAPTPLAAPLYEYVKGILFIQIARVIFAYASQ